jgi:hypothetical protein
MGEVRGTSKANKETHLNSAASSPQSSLLLLIAWIGIEMISPFFTRILHRRTPCLSTYPPSLVLVPPLQSVLGLAPPTGISSTSRMHTRIVFVTGACTRSVSRTTQSRYSHPAMRSASSGSQLPSPVLNSACVPPPTFLNASLNLPCTRWSRASA